MMPELQRSGIDVYMYKIAHHIHVCSHMVYAWICRHTHMNICRVSSVMDMILADLLLNDL